MNEEYYILEADYDERFPILEWSEDELPYLKVKELEIERPIQMELGEPIPKKYELADHMSVPGAVFSKKISDVIRELNLPGVQLIPVDLSLPNGDELSNTYEYLHVYNAMDVIDVDASDCTFGGKDQDHIIILDKLSLDSKKVADVELEKRLLFCLGKIESTILYHKSIVDRIQATGATGLAFYTVEEWDSNLSF